MHRRLAALIVTASALSGSSLAAQGEPQAKPVFRVGSNLVVLDLVARHRDGTVVRDLRPEDIELRENGQRREVRLLELVERSPDAGPAPVARAQASTDRPTNTLTPAADAPDLIVIVFDFLGMSPAEAGRARDALNTSPLRALLEGREVILAAAGNTLRVELGVTADPQLLARALSALPIATASKVPLSSIFEEVDRTCSVRKGQRVIDAAIERAVEYVDESHLRVRRGSENLIALLRALSQRPGRKSVLLFSNGYAANPVEQAVDTVATAVAACIGGDPMQYRRRAQVGLGARGSGDVVAAAHALALQANAAQASVYAVDVTGLDTSAALPESVGRTTSGGVLPPIRLPGTSRYAGRDYLQVVADDTGGRTVFDTNDLATGVRSAVGDARSYYLVGFEPAAQVRSPVRSLEFKVKRKDVQTLFRRSYTLRTTPNDPLQDIEEALAAPTLFEGRGLRAETALTSKELAVRVYIPLALVDLQRRGDGSEAHFVLHGNLQDDATGTVRPIAGKTFALQWSGAELARVASAQNLVAELRDDRPPDGRYLLSIVFRAASGRMAAVRVSVDVR